MEPAWKRLRNIRSVLTPHDTQEEPTENATNTTGQAKGSLAIALAAPPPVALQRSDVTMIKPYARGSLSGALAVAASKDSLSEAVTNLESKKMTKGAASAAAKRLQTWDAIAAQAGFNGKVFSPDEMNTIIAVLNEANYRSVASYVSDAKLRLIALGHEWTQQHQLKRKQCERACARGRGPPQGAAPFPLQMAAALPADDSPLWECHEDAPAYPRTYIILSSWWLAREIESE
eukprot:TRINITY_DN92647_c0_g1_i1.p1 TRINITY_DN92647_c0_g1~~TRINITY_DN92647_c0_g1_i1.p1  ORF type:complete len:239 (+),score=44.91 TRINITY_DN92647_c0_g1_i1:24-719(+)